MSAHVFVPPANFVCGDTPHKLCGGYTVFTLSVCASIRLCVCPNGFVSLIEESLLDFHQTLQTYSYMQDKYFKQKSKG